LLKFLGKTLLEHQIEVAKGAGLTEFIIVGAGSAVSYLLGCEVKDYFPGVIDFHNF